MKVNLTDINAWKVGVQVLMEQQERTISRDALLYGGAEKWQVDQAMKAYQEKTQRIHGWSSTFWTFECLFQGNGWALLQPVETVVNVYNGVEIKSEPKHLRRAYLLVEHPVMGSPYATIRFKNYSKPEDLKNHLNDVFDSFPNDACRNAVNHIQLLNILEERDSVVVFTHNT